MKDMKHQLPFKIGQQAESKSFLGGFRGAWFRCNIKDIGMKKGQSQYYLEYFDFPDERIRWTKLYQKPPSKGNTQLMVRPCFPRLYRENEMPDPHSISEVVAVVDDAWKVGDLVDWWYDGCYWSGRVVCLLGKDKVQIALPEPPLGEGSSYEAFSKDLRPSLDWSPEYGWTVPFSGDKETSRCARLVHPSKKDQDRIQSAVDENQDRSEMPSIGPLHSSTKELLDQTCGSELNKGGRRSMELEFEGSGFRKANCSDRVSSSHNRETNALGAMNKISSVKDRFNSRYPSKKMRICEAERMTSMMYPDTIETSVLALEELVNKIKWLKGVTKYGFQYANARKPSWRFLAPHASFTQKDASKCNPSG